jgi:hypothetical protein
MSSAGLLFEALVRRILEAKNFVIHEHGQALGDAGFDFIARLGPDAWAIEVKYYRTVRPQVSLLEAAASRLTSRAPRFQAKKGMLVVSCLVPPELRTRLEEKFSLTIIDRSELLAWITGIPELLDALSALLDPTPSELEAQPTRRALEDVDARYLGPAGEPEDSRGTDLCTQLRELKRGKTTWAAYETICEGVLRYLFSNDLQGWHKQKSTDDGLNRFDYVCRIRPTTDFWQFVVQHLDSRYAVFEFKNYAEKIKQGQILTTEKYLLERGLRRVAVVFSRLGADANATRMARGAMREQGKLILVLSDEDVCKMLHMKERGEDPSDFLFETADNFLLALAR